MASAKQKAAARKNIKKAIAARKAQLKSKAKKAKPSKSRKLKSRTKSQPVKIKRKTSSKKSMAKKRGSRSKSSSGSNKLINQAKRFAKPVMIGLGAAGTIGLIGNTLGQPQLAQNKLVSSLISFVIGGPIAGATTFLLSPGGQSNGGQSGGMI